MIALVLAGGMGSRYGGDKQRDEVGPGGEWIMDYNLVDAAAAGFERAVIVCRPEHVEEIRERMAARPPAELDIVCVAQHPDDVPVAMPPRAKPWGTGHATLAGRSALDQPFCVINADDLYGPETFKVAAELLRASGPGRGGLVPFCLGACLSDHGAVSRGVCQIENGELGSVVEHHELRREGDKILGVGPDGETVTLDADTPVSLNTWCLHPSTLGQLEANFERWLQAGPGPKDEFQLPTALDQLLRAGELRITCTASPETWCGVTTQQDRTALVAHLARRSSQATLD